MIKKFCDRHHRSSEQCRVKRLISLLLWSHRALASVLGKPRSIVMKWTSVFGQLHLLWAVRLIPWCRHPYGQAQCHMHLSLIPSLSILTGTSSSNLLYSSSNFNIPQLFININRYIKINNLLKFIIESHLSQSNPYLITLSNSIFDSKFPQTITTFQDNLLANCNP